MLPLLRANEPFYDAALDETEFRTTSPEVAWDALSKSIVSYCFALLQLEQRAVDSSLAS